MKKKNSELIAATSGSGEKKRETSKPKDFPSKDFTNVLIGNYKVIKILGRGGFGVVFEAFDQERGRTVAIKQVDLSGTTADEQESILMEIQLLQELQHPNIVKYIDTVQEDGKLNIVLEYIESGQLSSLFAKSGGRPSEVLMTNYVSQILTGLAYLHSQGVVHRDVKGANILTTKEGILKLADFGVATKLTEASEQSDVVGSPYWMAPEIIEMKGSNDSSACDIWSLGCTIIELLTGKPPYLELNAMAAMYRIVQDDFPPYPATISPEMDSFLKKCFCKDPELRPTADELLRHPWITKGAAAGDRKEAGSPSANGTERIIPPTPKAVVPAMADKSQAGLDMSKYIESLHDLAESVFVDNCKDLEKLLLGQAAHSLRIRLLHTGVMPLLDHLRSPKSPTRLMALLSVLFETLQPLPDKGVTKELTNDIAAVFLTTGFSHELVKHCGYSEHPVVRANVSALLRYLCFSNGPLFVCAGGLSGLVTLLDVDYSSNAVRLPFTALDCIERLYDCPPLCSDDVARILASRHDMVRVVVTCLSHAHDLHPHKIKDTLPKRFTADKRKKLLKHKTLTSRPAPLSVSRGSYVEGGDIPVSPKPKDKNKGSLRAPLETLSPLSPKGDDLLSRAVHLCVPTTPKGLKSIVDDSATPISGSYGIIEKLAKHVHLLAKSSEEVQLMFATKQELETLMDVCVSCPQGQIVSSILNAFSTLVSNNTVLKAILKDAVNADSPVLVHLISLLDRFITSDFCGAGGSAAGWAIADIVFVLYKLVTDPKALGMELKQEKNEMGLLASLVDMGLVPMLQEVMSAVADSAAKKEEGKSRVAGNMRTIRLTVSVNAANIQGKRDSPCALHDFLFPLLSRIAREEDRAIRATLHAWSPKLFLPLLAHPVFRGETLDILIIWLLDDPKIVEEFMGLPSTIACVVVALFEGSAQECHAFLLALYRMFSHSARINRCFSDYPEFIEEIRKCVMQKHEKHNLHTNIKICALKLIHQMLSNSESLDKLITALDLKNLLEPLCADDKNKIVHKLSTGLRHQFLERDDLDGQAGKGEKYRRRDIKKCMNCKKSFGLLHRKHMCKQCQHIVCGQCSKQKLVVPQLGKGKPRRVCNNCASFLGN